MDNGNEPPNYEGIWKKIAEPAIILSLFTVVFYLFIIIYNKSFFNKFSFPYQFANIPSAFSISKFMDIIIINSSLFLVSIVICIIINLLLLKIKNFRRYDKDHFFYSVMDNIRIYILFILFINCLCFNINFRTIIFDFFYNFEVIILSVIVLGTIWLYFFSRLPIKEAIESIYEHPMLYAAIIVVLSSSLIVNMGSYDAQRIIEGDIGTYQVKLNMDSQVDNSLNKTLILVMLQEGNYFLVEKQKPAPLISPLYIISANKVESATINLTANQNLFNNVFIYESIGFVSKIFNGNGKKPIYPVISSLFIIILFCLIYYYIFGLRLIDCLSLSVAAFLSGIGLSLKPTIEGYKYDYQKLVSIERLLGLVFSILFIISFIGFIMDIK